MDDKGIEYMIVELIVPLNFTEYGIFKFGELYKFVPPCVSFYFHHDIVTGLPGEVVKGGVLGEVDILVGCLGTVADTHAYMQQQLLKLEEEVIDMWVLLHSCIFEAFPEILGFMRFFLTDRDNVDSKVIEFLNDGHDVEDHQYTSLKHLLLPALGLNDLLNDPQVEIGEGLTDGNLVVLGCIDEGFVLVLLLN
jgi:hypothetical protein